MNYIVFLLGFVIFFFSLCLHVIIWRWFNPGKKIAFLLLIFIAIPVGSYFVFSNIIHIDYKLSTVSVSGTDWMAVYMLHISLSLAYILSYPAVEAASPSLVILLMMDNSKEDGLVFNDLSNCFRDDMVLQPRIQDLINSGLIIESHDGYYRLTPRGITFVKCFILLRRLLGLPIGKG